MDLEGMKYADLQRLAKKLGVKANMKSDKLILAIRAVADAGPGDLTSDEEPVGTEPVTKPTKSFKEKSGRLLSETTTDESQDEDMRVVEKSKKVKRGHGKTDVTTVSTTDESQDESDMAVEEKPRGRNGKRKKTAVKEKKKKDLVTVGARQRSSSRKKTPESLTGTTPGTDMEGRSQDKPTPPVPRKTPIRVKKTPVVSRKTPVVSRKTPLVSKPPTVSRESRNTPKVSRNTPLVSRKTPIVSRKTPIVSRKTPIVFRRTPVPARRTPLGRKSPVVKKITGQKLVPQETVHRRTRSGEKPSVQAPTVQEPTDRKRKRSSDKLNSTFDLEDDPPEAKRTRPSIDGRTDVTMPRDDVTAERDDVTGMIDTMRSSMSKDEMKQALEAAISKSVKKKHVTMVEPTTEEKSHIPRFVAYVNKKQENPKKPVTPGNKDWSRIHKAQFDKMDSLDDYLKKRKERTNKLLQSVDKAKQTAAESQVRIREASRSVIKSCVTKSAVAGTSRENENQSKFVPSVTDVADIETNFTALNNNAKTPRANVTKPLTSLNASVRSVRKSTAYDGDQSLLAKTPKHSFDLKASLSKPLSWKPYTGKLQPIEGVKSMIGKQSANKKEERRQNVQKKRKDVKMDAQMKRRGITT